MLSFKFYLRAALFCLLASLASATVAQSARPIALIADHISFDPNTNILSASGNVRILYQGQILTTQKIIYNQQNGTIHIPGQLTATYQDNTTVRAQSAELSDDLRNGLIQGAQVLIEKQFQIATSELQRREGRFQIMHNAVASSCYVCAEKLVPFWQIRAKRIIHDIEEKQIFFEEARLEFLGIPVFWMPYLRTPDPSVDRASGVLPPKFISSTTLGQGVKIPYYWTLGDHADLTLTPFITTRGSAVLEGEYRRQTRNGGFEFDGAFLVADDLSHLPYRSFLRGNGRFDLGDDYILNFGLDVVSDKEFKAEYRYGTEDRLQSFLNIEQTRHNSFFSIGTAYTQSLRSNEIDTNIPLIFPEAYFRKTWQEDFLGGHFGVSAQSVTLLRSDSHQMFRLGFDLDWRKNWQLTNGMLFEVFAELEHSSYFTSNDPVFDSDHYSRTTPTLAMELRWPWSAARGGVTHVVEPIVQLVWSPESMKALPNEDSLQVEFEETNLFSYNRFPGYDAMEVGFRANVGVSYWRYDPNGWNLGVTVGRVFREKDHNQFSAASGLAGGNSDYVSKISLQYLDRIELTNRTLFSGDFDVSKNETQLNFSAGGLTAGVSYAFLEANVVPGISRRIHEAAIEAAYQINDYWSGTLDWRRDLETSSSISGEIGLIYENECVKVNLSYSLQYATSDNVTPSKEFGLKIELAGLGNKKLKKKYARRCDAY